MGKGAGNNGTHHKDNFTQTESRSEPKESILNE